VAIALAATAVVAVSAVVTIESDSAAEPSDPVLVATPLLSARRVPLLTSTPVAERRLAAALGELMGRVPGNSCLTVRVGGREIFASNPDAPLVPASVEKLVTATVALQVLAPDHLFRTSVRAAAAPAGGVVAGDLYVVGGGDPLLMTDDYERTFRDPPQVRSDVEALADAVVAAGITAVQGRVVGDESRYDTNRDVDAWPARFQGQNLSGPLSALMVNDGFVFAEPEPPPPPRDETGEPLPNEVPPPRRVPATDPPAHAADVLTALLEQRGVDVGAGPASGVAPVGSVEVAGLDSPPLGQVIAQMLSESDNTTAELMVKELGVQAGGAGTTAAGLDVINRTLGELGLAVPGVRASDGSGLADLNQVTCHFVQALLDRAGPSSLIGTGLAVAGQTGTLSERFRGTAAEGRLRAKTGTLRQVTALAGFIIAPTGATISFAYVVNLGGSDLVNGPDRLLQRELAQHLGVYPQVPPDTELGPRATDEAVAESEEANPP
jgi:D-alanyl-D-alanine carboxypeptidase/D-alanyl-D-alanine-endopeptidase (penicillin-binding protein 4)